MATHVIGLEPESFPAADGRICDPCAEVGDRNAAEVVIRHEGVEIALCSTCNGLNGLDGIAVMPGEKHEPF
jgi:hypothetical protein